MVLIWFGIRLVRVSLAALAGNWIGGKLRSLLTGKRVQTMRFVHTTASGTTIDNTPVATKFYPAMLFALAGRPHWMYAALGGVLVGLLVDDKYEAMWLERVLVPAITRMSSEDFPAERPDSPADDES